MTYSGIYSVGFVGQALSCQTTVDDFYQSYWPTIQPHSNSLDGLKLVRPPLGV